MGFHSLFLFVQATLLRLGMFILLYQIWSKQHQLGYTFIFLVGTLKTVEAERISVDHVAHLKPSDGGSAATQC